MAREDVWGRDPGLREQGVQLVHHLAADPRARAHLAPPQAGAVVEDRKSTRLNSSHANISYAVFCLKKKKQRLSSSASERAPFTTTWPNILCYLFPSTSGICR